MVVKKALIHQSIFAQAPELFPEIMYFFLIGGGMRVEKHLRCRMQSLSPLQNLQGKKDKEGRKPKIGICGITLTFLKKTLSGVLTQVA